MTEWQPIETAPRDGTKIALLIPYKPHPEVDAGYWEPLEDSDDPWIPDWGKRDGGCFRFTGDDGAYDIQPTHWMPIPQETTNDQTSARQDC